MLPRWMWRNRFGDNGHTHIMGLDDLLDDVEQYPVGSVSSRMKGENIPVTDDAWVQILCHNPSVAYSVLTFSSFSETPSKESVARKFVELLDKVVQDEVPGTSVSDKERDHAEQQRDEIIADYLE